MFVSLGRCFITTSLSYLSMIYHSLVVVPQVEVLGPCPSHVFILFRAQAENPKNAFHANSQGSSSLWKQLFSHYVTLQKS